MQAEDFLYHLYRGTELLQGDRVHEAKEELEAALRLSPMDPKSQDLLGVVYFRLGLYPRAIEIFEELARAHPTQRTPKINLALCYLKTAQSRDARRLLEQVVAAHPSDARAWGYLGLAYERLDDLDKAREAYLRGGHVTKARRLDDASAPRSSMDPMSQIRGELASLPPIDGATPTIAIPPPSGVPRCDDDTVTALEVARGLSIATPAVGTATPLAGGWIAVAPGERFACRWDALRSTTSPGPWDTSPLARHARGFETDEPLGGRVAPLRSLRGATLVTMGPRPGFVLTVLRAAGSTLLVREDALTALGDLAYETRACGADDAHPGLFVVRLRGEGFVVVEAPGPLTSIELPGTGGVVVPEDVFVGAVGEVEARRLSEGDAPEPGSGHLELRGEGFVLLVGR